MRNNLYPAPQVRKNFLGGISAMTEYRWWQRGFPRPKKVNGRNYYTTEQVEIEIPKWIENGGGADE